MFQFRLWVERHWQQTLVLVLGLVNLGFIIWAVNITWYHACYASAPHDLTRLFTCFPQLTDFISLLVALGFWGIALLFLGSGRLAPTVFFLLIASILVTGKLSAFGSDLEKRLFAFLLAWLPLTMLYFHAQLLEKGLQHKLRPLLTGSCIVAVVLAIPPVLWQATILEEQPWFDIWRINLRVNVILAVGLTVLLLRRGYQQSVLSATRRRIRYITFGALCAFTPLTLLSLLPDMLGMPLHVPYEFTFPCLLISPLTYAYTILPLHLTRLSNVLSRTAVYYLLITLILSAYLVVIGFLQWLDIHITEESLGVNALLIIILLFLFMPLHQGLWQLINWFWHGNEAVYAHVVGQLSESLALTLDRETLKHLLLDELAVTMRLLQLSLFLKDQNRDLALMGSVNFALDTSLRLPLSGNLIAYLETVTKPISASCLRQFLGNTPLQASESQLLSLPGVSFWLPLISAGTLQGLLVLGSRVPGVNFTPEDERILVTLSHQAGIAAHNVYLIEEVQTRRRELAKAHQQLLMVREQERQQIACWLHDSAVQQLLGLSYQLAGLQRQVEDGFHDGLSTPTLEATRHGVLAVVRQLRQLIGELRPAGLAELGLTIALEGYVARLQREGRLRGMPCIELDLDRSIVSLPEPVAICLFRTAQEGIRNALKHADARRIDLSLFMNHDEVILNVHDDGKGFQMPTRLGELVWNEHFGLVGMSERIAWVGGHLTINSQPGSGTKIVVQIPLPSKEKTNGQNNTSPISR